MIDLKLLDVSDEFQSWKDLNGILHIAGCRHDMLVGNIDTLVTIPEFDEEQATVYKGSDAYAHLLMYVTGLLSRTPGESQIVSQFKNAYKGLKAINYELVTDMHRVFQCIIRDNSLVRNCFTRGLKPAFYEACAHELSEQQRNEAVLVVGHTNKSGVKPDSITENIVRYLGNNRRDAAQTIVFTHPDGESLNNIYSSFLKLKVKGRISSNIEILPFDNAFDVSGRLLDFQRVFVCYPMDANQSVDRKIILEWGQREALGGTLVHLGGNNGIDRTTKGIWGSAGLERYVSPEDIRGWQDTRKAQNASVKYVGNLVCRSCADLRIEGEKPSYKSVSQKLEL